MTKTELMETYTAEQLAEMVATAIQSKEDDEKLIEIITSAGKNLGKQLDEKQIEIDRLQSEVEKYLKAFEQAKKERDCQIAEYQKKIEELKVENAELHCEMQAMKVFPDEIPTEPIKVADMLINAEGEYEHNPIVRKICGTDKGKYRIFDVSELRQIAEHLLVYCNHNGEVQE